MSLPRWIRIGEWALFALLAVYLCGHSMPRAWRTLNTDFPNYYLTAHLAREGSDTSRLYEWVWLQRQKNHHDIDQRIVGLGAITPFSMLVVWPIAFLPALAAKHCWLALNLVFLFATAVSLRSLTQLAWRRIGLVMALSVPLQRNLLFGQYYLLLLFVLTTACWCYVHQKRFLSGLLIGFGFGLKIFPFLFLGYFLRKKDLKAFAGGIVGCVAAAVISVATFGLQANRVLLIQVLPWALRGEAMDPYNPISSSVATLLHRLFVYEPQWNPHPWIHAPWMFAVLLPLVQSLLFAPALLLARPVVVQPKRLHLEWSAVLLGSLAISTLPASYHFTLLILPVCLMWEAVEERRSFLWTGILLFLYLAIGFPWLDSIGIATGLAIFRTPRLYLVAALCIFNYILLADQRRGVIKTRESRIWAGAFVTMTLLSIASGLRHQRGLYEDYRLRLPTSKSMLQAIAPVMQKNNVLFTAMLPSGYHSAYLSEGVTHFEGSPIDQLALASTVSDQWTEEVGHESTIVSTLQGQRDIQQAESPVASANGRWLGFLREDKGRARIWLRTFDQPMSADKTITPPELNVLEMTFLPNGSLIFSAARGSGRPGLYLVDQSGGVGSVETEESRYPAVSPNGRWLAYSKLQSGNWNLWLRDLHSGQTSRLTLVECNNIQAAWASDSQTLIYASDCGRALWFTALCARHISQ